MMRSSKQTHDYDTIKKWVEKHDGVPAVVADTPLKVIMMGVENPFS